MFLRQSLSLNLELTSWGTLAGWEVPGICPSPYSQAGVTDTLPCPAFPRMLRIQTQVFMISYLLSYCPSSHPPVLMDVVLAFWKADFIWNSSIPQLLWLEHVGTDSNTSLRPWCGFLFLPDQIHLFTTRRGGSSHVFKRCVYLQPAALLERAHW